MYKIFNSQAITRQQRFSRAILVGSVTAFVLAIVYGFISSLMHIEFSIAFVGMGYAIGWVICNYGRGVQLQFSILGAFLAAFSFMIADLIAYFGFAVLVPSNFLPSFIIYVSMLFNLTSISSLLGFLFRAYGVYIAYINSRIGGH